MLVTVSRVAHYEVIAALGSGGMGEVYRAHDTHIKREVALKILPPAMAADPDRTQRFEKEAIAAGMLNHPNVLTWHTPSIAKELLM